MRELIKLGSRPGAVISDENVKLGRAIVLTASIFTVLFALLKYLMGDDAHGSLTRSIILVAALMAMALMRVGRLTLAFVIYGWGVWLGITSEALLTGSVDNTLLYLYPALILVGGWLLGMRHGYAMCLMSALALFVLAWMETSGIKFIQFDRGPWGRAADISVILLVGMLLLQSISRSQQRQGSKMAELNARLSETVANLTSRETQLSQAESRFAKVGDIVPAPLSLTDASTGETVYVNKAWESVLGWKQQDVLGKSPLELGVWYDPAARQAYGAEFRRNGCVRNLEMTVQGRDGRLLSVSVSADSVEQDGRRLTMSLLFDLTDRKLAEAKVMKSNAELEARVEQRTLELKSTNDELSNALTTLQHAQKELVQSEKLAALGSMVAGVSHELNTPIGNAMVVASSMHDRAREFQGLVIRNELKRSLLERFMTDSLEGAELVQRSLQRASDLVHSFKQVAVDQTSERQRVFNLDEVVREIIATLRPNLKKMPWKIAIDIPRDITLDSFPGALGQVTINIVMNAAIHAFAGRTEGRISVHGRQIDNESVELVFADDGVGMPADVMSRIFDPFFTTRLGTGGSGLGLAIVHQMVTQVLQGRVSVESQVGEGSRFTVILARIIEHQVEQAVPPV